MSGPGKLSDDSLNNLRGDVDKVLDKRLCEQSFRFFLNFWKFTNRETGAELRFDEDTLWDGQRAFVDVVEEHDWVMALKAGKLGFTELECAFDAWRALFGGRNTRVHVFSRVDDSAKDLLGYIDYGLSHLPGWLRPKFSERAGGRTMHSLRFRMGPKDVRTIVSYASSKEASIDQSCQHAHVDELARMPFPVETWNAVFSTVAPEGTCHIVTRGKGEDNHAAVLWKAAKAGTSRLHPFFQSWSARSDRDRKWYDVQSGSLTLQGLRQFAPETEEDALAADEQNDYIQIAWWDSCKEELPPFEPGNKEAVVLAVDAGVTGDCFGIVAITRHPDPERYSNSVAVRAVRLWKPPKGGAIDFSGPEGFLRWCVQGGCAAGHPKEEPFSRPAECAACREGPFVTKPYNVIQIAYDPYQLESMMQSLRRDITVWCEAFNQGTDRLKSDSGLRDLIIQKRIAHGGNADLREHLDNAAAKLESKEESKLRIVKKSPEKKVDLAVATSMGAHKCLYLLL